MPEVAVNERAVLVARRNTLMSELLRIAPTINPPSPETARQPSNHDPVRSVKRGEVEKVKENESVKKARDVIKREPKQTGDVFADNPNLHVVNGVHMDIYSYFCKNPASITPEQQDRLSFIYSWVLDNSKTFREGMLKLNRLDTKLGSADAGEAKILKLYNYLRIRYGNS